MELSLQERSALPTAESLGIDVPAYSIKKRNGSLESLSFAKVVQTLARAGALQEPVSLKAILKETFKNLFDGASTHDVELALILGTSVFIERDFAYSRLASRLFRQKILKEVLETSISGDDLVLKSRQAFVENIQLGVQKGYLDPRMLEFDLVKLSQELDFDRDLQLDYIGIQTLYERYFLKDGKRVLETPQAFWMRTAMGLALFETEKEKWAVEFYNQYSQLLFVSSTPTLFHSGLSHPQLSSCYLSTVEDDLTSIFKVLGDNAQLSKWSGGIGNDWTNIRATGSAIKSTQVESQGVIPFLKIANDVTVAINRSGKRRGATCAYLETWHMDIEDFLDLKRNTGDERRRTHDMNTANWIPDLFMKRVAENGEWTLFSPSDVPDLHDSYGKKFEERYLAYEQMTRDGRIQHFKRLEALKLWRKMLTRLFETGHPWITFKDPSNIRSPQDHVGVVHNSNLCTEITLNNSADETAVCNLGSVNLARFIRNGELDREALARTIHIGMRMLDNVVDINYYPTVEAKKSNLRHRPVGLGLMGFQDALFQLRLPFESDAALEFADRSMEFISYHAILASTALAAEKGAYETFPGSKWDRGLLPLDTIDLLEKERGVPVDCDRSSTLDWDEVRAQIKKHGMRNSNTMAIAPTATISNIADSFPCIEPIYKNIYVKANMSGEFTVVNTYLVEDLKERGLWTPEMLEKLKYYDGNLAPIAEIPEDLKALHKEAFECDPLRLIQMTARRGKWVDQSQSHNVFLKGSSGKQLEQIYMEAWKAGLKTTYYLRSMAATQIEKSTLDAGKYGFTQKRVYQTLEESSKGVQKELQFKPVPGNEGFDEIKVEGVPASQVGAACSVLDPTCEACQ
ncbi:MAG: ribonucleoside-diphosphate reductase subunit alpha [Spirochaetales bacterium]|nr:ribonucleoside-diphosphate reductase subunit alpha [Spirochaetales bacterium]